ncbi:MAG: hypothetical protein N2322_03410 [Terrimicrobiaceae bacterium]|nr:hypothetical protein [Terrimicrobiaceae bacterium]
MSSFAHRLCLVLIAAAGSVAELAAQSGADSARTTDRVFSALNSFESFSPTDSFAESSPADPDLGEQVLLTPRKSYRPFSVTAAYSAFWTSNAFYTPDSPAGDMVMGLTADALALPHIGSNFFLEGSGKVGGYRYFLNPSLDFNSVEATAGVLKVFRELWDIGLYGRYEFLHLWSPGAGGLLTEHALAAGLRKTFQFSRAHALFLSFEADFSLGGTPSYALAHEFNFFAAHQLEWSRWFSTSFFWQMAIFDFREDTRADLRNFIGLSAGVRPLRWLTVSASSWLGWNASNESEFDFFVANLGGGITASINF